MVKGALWTFVAPGVAPRVPDDPVRLVEVGVEAVAHELDHVVDVRLVHACVRACVRVRVRVRVWVWVWVWVCACVRVCVCV